MTGTCVYLPALIGGGYGGFWRCRRRYRVVKGGKASKKSSTTALWYIYHLMKYPDANLLVVRSVHRTHGDSTYAQLRWAIRRLRVEHLWKASKEPLELTYLPTGQRILFRGMDNVEKLASTTVERGYLCWVWIEEAFEIAAEADFDKLDLSVPRGDEGEDKDGGHATLLTRFWKEWDEAGNAVVRGMQVCGTVTVREPWELGIRLYPLTVFRWEEKRHQCYGESEIPYLIPNQIAINRTVSAGVWAVMMMGMPMMLVNGDVVTGPVTNDPGQIIPVYGSGEEVRDAVRYVDPPAFSAQLDANVQGLIRDTMAQAGVSTTLLGDIEPHNTSAIIAVREASLMPLTMMQNRFYSFIEDVARVWSEFWMAMYGSRGLKIAEEQGVWYMPFDGACCRDLLMSITADAVSGDTYSDGRTIEMLDNLYTHGIINARQYLSRLPKGTVPRMETLLQEVN